MFLLLLMFLCRFLFNKTGAHLQFISTISSIATKKKKKEKQKFNKSEIYIYPTDSHSKSKIYYNYTTISHRSRWCIRVVVCAQGSLTILYTNFTSYRKTQIRLDLRREYNVKHNTFCTDRNMINIHSHSINMETNWKSL